MARLVVFCVLLLALGHTAAFGRYSASPRSRLASLSRQSEPLFAFPNSLEEAKAIHQTARAHAEHVQLSHGHVAPSPSAMRAFLPIQHQPQPTMTTAAPLTTPPAHAGPAVFSPIAYGADPTGSKDSTEAFDKAMAALLSINVSSPKMAAGIVSLGGATLDLQGGIYLISKPIVIPTFIGDMRIVRGTLAASASFPSSSFLIQIGDPACDPDQQKSCNEFIEISEIFLDARHVAAGCIQISSTMGATLGPSIFFHGFLQSGLHVIQSHEAMLTNAWVAENYWSDPRPAASSSIGILFDGNDHILNDVIVFDYTKTGVEVNGAANILIGVHTWNGGGVGIRVTATNTRLIGCYLDYNYLELVDPSKITVTDTFFLQTTAHFTAVKGSASDIVMRGNSFTGSAPDIVVNGTFSQLSNVRVDSDFGNSRHTAATHTQRVSGAAFVQFDFSSALLFNSSITSTLYSVVFEDRTAVLTPHGVVQTGDRQLQVIFQSPVNASITVSVTQTY